LVLKFGEFCARWARVEFVTVVGNETIATAYLALVASFAQYEQDARARTGRSEAHVHGRSKAARPAAVRTNDVLFKVLRVNSLSIGFNSSDLTSNLWPFADIPKNSRRCIGPVGSLPSSVSHSDTLK
jgi:hypothetical protein